MRFASSGCPDCLLQPDHGTPRVGRLYDADHAVAFGPDFEDRAEAEAFLRWYREDVLTDGIGWEDESEAPPADLRELSESELVAIKHVWDVNKADWLAFESRASTV